MSQLWDTGRMETRLASYATRQVPRYTSYPTAPHFSGDIDATIAEKWFDDLDENARLSIYLHIPFCREMCRYCGCHTKVTHKDEPIADYVETLRREIALVIDHAGGRPVTHIHWGGGTPSILKPEQFSAIVADLRDGFRFTDILDHAIELDPRTVTPDMVAVLAENGITRASLGVQDFTPKVQEAIGRIQTVETVANVVGLLRDVGIDAINFDLMYGLPHQTVDDVRRTAEIAAEMKPSRLAIFGYAHVPWFKSHQKLIDAAELPGAMERLDQAAAAEQTLSAAGYVPIGIDHFAHPDDTLAIAQRAGELRRNFQGYTTDNADALVALGASSIGCLPQGFVQNAPDVGGWRRAIESGHLAAVRGYALTPEDCLRADIIERLMCDFEVDLAAFTMDDSGFQHRFAADLERLAQLVDDELVEIDGSHVRILKAGRPFSRIVAACFDTFLAAGTARHSAAV